MTTREELLAAIRHSEANPPTSEQFVKRVEAWLARDMKAQDWGQIGVPLHVPGLYGRRLPDRGMTVIFIRTAKAEVVELVEAAKTDPHAWDEACRQAALHIRDGGTPPYLLEFTCKVLLGELPRPTRGRRKPFERNYQICMAVNALVELAEFHATINDAADDESRSRCACGFVADRLGESYNSVAAIWAKRARFRLSVEPFRNG